MLPLALFSLFPAALPFGSSELEEDYQYCGAGGRLGLRGLPTTRRGRRSRRKAIIASLLKILVEETGSPPESEEEAEN